MAAAVCAILRCRCPGSTIAAVDTRNICGSAASLSFILPIHRNIKKQVGFAGGAVHYSLTCRTHQNSWQRPRSHPPTHPPTHSLTNSRAHPPTHLPTYLPTYPPTYLPTHDIHSSTVLPHLNPSKSNRSQTEPTQPNPSTHHLGFLLFARL